MSANWIYFMKLVDEQIPIDITTNSIYKLFKYVETNDIENVIEMIGLEYPKLPIYIPNSDVDLLSSIREEIKLSIEFSKHKLFPNITDDNLSFLEKSPVILENNFQWILETYNNQYKNYLILFFNLIIKGNLIYARTLSSQDIQYILSLFQLVRNEQYSFVGRPVHIDMFNLIEMELNISMFYLQSVIEDEKYYNLRGKKESDVTSDWSKRFIYKSYNWFSFVNNKDTITQRIEELNDHEYGIMASQYPMIKKHVSGFDIIKKSMICFFQNQPQPIESINLIKTAQILSTTFNDYLFTEPDGTTVPYLYTYRLEQVPVSSTGKLYSDLKQGEQIELFRPTSTSYGSPNIKFQGLILIRFRIPRNVAFICVDGIKEMNEHEVILPAGTQCKCIRKWYDVLKIPSMLLYIDFDVVPNF